MPGRANHRSLGCARDDNVAGMTVSLGMTASIGVTQWFVVEYRWNCSSTFETTALESVTMSSNSKNLVPLPFDSWKDTQATLHMWTQVVGKIRLELTPLVNHWWNVPLYVTARGLTTSPMPYDDRTLEISFDFIEHKLLIETCEGESTTLPLRPQSVAAFYQSVMAALTKLGTPVKIWTMPREVPDPIPFEKDEQHASYDAEAVHKFWRILVWVDEVLKQFRAPFIGKVSPVHFFWGSFDMAVTRFSGRLAQPPPTAKDKVTAEAYSHEVSSAGFWAGGGEIKGPAFYSYAAPAPEGFAKATVRPSAAFYHQDLNEFVMMYDDIRNAEDPERMLLDFCQSTYVAAANLGKWDRSALERGRK
jgi:hypothetical protein